MPVQTELIEKGRVFHCIVTDPWTTADTLEATARMVATYEQSPGTIHTLMDVSNLRQVPPGFLSVRQNAALNHPKAGHMVIIGASLLVKTLVNAVAKLAHFDHVVYFTSREEAEAHIRAILEAEGTAV